MADVAAQAMTLKAEELERIDRMTERHERRRDVILQQIEKRRAGWSQQVKRASEEVVDLEHHEYASVANANGSPTEDNSA